MSCDHTYEASSYHGPVRRAYTGLFCPDCGARIEAPGKTCLLYTSDAADE